METRTIKIWRNHPNTALAWTHKNKAIINVSWIGQYAYCPQEIYLLYVKNVKPEMTGEIIEGTIKHEESFDKFLSGPGEKVTAEELSSGTVECEAREFRAFNETYGIMGRKDAFTILKDKYVITDWKNKPKALPIYYNDRMQLLGYALLARNGEMILSSKLKKSGDKIINSSLTLAKLPIR